MRNNRASERYAKSLFQLSIKDNLLNDVKSDIDYLKKLFSSSREISQLYINPIIPIYHKIEITNRIFKGKINDLTLRMMLNVIYRKRDNLIENILLKFNEITEMELINLTLAIIIGTFFFIGQNNFCVCSINIIQKT